MLGNFKPESHPGCAFSHLIHDTYSSFLASILPLLIEKLGFSYTLARFLTAARRFPSLLNPLLGVKADTISFRYFLTIAYQVVNAAEIAIKDMISR